MRQIRNRLRARADREMARGLAAAESGDLGKDEPHPMAALAPGAQLGDHVFIDWRLRIDEALEVERIAHTGLLHCRVRSACSEQNVGDPSGDDDVHPAMPPGTADKTDIKC